MRTPQRLLSRKQKSRIVSISAPVGGLNARDPLAGMAADDAIKLDNFFCTPYDVGVRLGYSIQTSGTPAQVNTLASYVPVTSGSAKLFSWSSDKIYNSSVAGAIGTPVISGNVSSTFQTVNFGTSAGIFLVGVSGSDLPLVYNGTVWSNAFASAFITAVTTVTSVGTTATCVMANPHNLKTGMSVILAGFTPAGYNGTYVITVTSTTTFTFTLAGALGVVTVTGTVTPSLNLTITGVDPTTFIQAAVFKTRLWFVQKESSKVWYMPTLSIGGAAASIDFSSLFSKGGYLMAMGDWSLDAGQGMDDYAAFISSNGQVAVYKGTDPSAAATWALVGVFDIGSPVGRRCFTKYAGDLLAITMDGLVPLSKALMSTRVNSRVALTDKVQHSIGSYLSLYSSSFGWESVLFPLANMLILNVPTLAGEYVQFAMNTISGAWSTFSGWNASCWVLHNDHVYFGGSNFVGKAWDTYADIGSAINIDGQQSFNYLGSNAQLKQVKMARPVVSSDGALAILFGTNVDFDVSIPTGVLSFTMSSAATWDSDLWDEGEWGGDPVIKKDWQSAFGIGYCVAAHMVGQVLNTRLHWSSTDFMVENGGMV